MCPSPHRKYLLHVHSFLLMLRFFKGQSENPHVNSQEPFPLIFLITKKRASFCNFASLQRFSKWLPCSWQRQVALGQSDCVMAHIIILVRVCWFGFGRCPPYKRLDCATVIAFVFFGNCQFTTPHPDRHLSSPASAPMGRHSCKSGIP